MSKTKIKSIRAQKRWSNHGQYTVEVEVGLRYGANSRAITPSTEKNLRNTKDIDFAVAYLNNELNQSLRGISALNQIEVDQILMGVRDTFKTHKTIPSVISSVSKAVLAAAADTEKLPLWQYLGTFLGGSSAEMLPLPSLSAFRNPSQSSKVSLISEFFLTPVGATSFGEAILWAELVRQEVSKAETGSLQDDIVHLDILTRAIEQAGLQPMQDVAISLTIVPPRPIAPARYRQNPPQEPVSRDALSGQLVDWVARYPICSIEDPFASDDFEGFSRLTWAVGKRVQVIGNTLVASNPIPPKNILSQKAGNALVIDSNPTRTISEVKSLASLAAANEFGAIISSGSDGLASASGLQFAIGWGIDQIRMTNAVTPFGYTLANEGLRIAEHIAKISVHQSEVDGALPPRKAFPWRLA